jgi:hypothetical protein
MTNLWASHMVSGKLLSDSAGKPVQAGRQAVMAEILFFVTPHVSAQNRKE